MLREAFQLELGERSEGADAQTVDPHGAASARSVSASVSSISPSRPARYARRASGSPDSSPASTEGASSSSSASSDAARSGDLECGAEQVRLAPVPLEIERRTQLVAAQLDAQRPERERELLG